MGFIRITTALLLLCLIMVTAACDVVPPGGDESSDSEETGSSSYEESGQDTAGYPEDSIGNYLDDYFTLKNPADNNPVPEKFFIIDSYEGLTALYDYIGASGFYTLHHNTGAYTDMTSGKYTERFFADGGRLAAVPVGTSSGSNTYYTYTDKTDGKLIIHIRRLNPYITISTDDLGRFVYLVPLPAGYTKEQISVIKDESGSATSAAFRAGQEEINDAGMFSGTYKRYDGKPYYTEGFWSLAWATSYDDAQGLWIAADGLRYKTLIEMNRDQIPAVMIADEIELYVAPKYNVKSVEYLLLDIGLETERNIASLAELTKLPIGAYYLVCRVFTEGRTVANRTERSEYYSIYLVNKSDYPY
ncbi:MAG TPA: hypothetical protein GX011_01370 [Clostridiales bacterium]|jgi:hypothetical protein|nr:hypothetical protein [Clostridiales bacterium]